MSDPLEKIHSAILDGRYALTEHAFEELDNDKLDILDLEAAVLTGRITQILTDDPRGSRYVIEGMACDLSTRVAVVSRFATEEQMLIITVFQLR